MSGSIYKVIELVGSSPDSWENAARAAVETAALSLSDIRIAEVVEQDIRLEENKVMEFRTKVRVSFKYHQDMAH